MRQLWSIADKDRADRMVDQPLFIDGGEHIAVIADGGRSQRSVFRRIETETGQVEGLPRQLPYDAGSVIGTSSDRKLLAVYSRENLGVWTPDGRTKMAPRNGFWGTSKVSFPDGPKVLFARTGQRQWSVVNWDRSRVVQSVEHPDANIGWISPDGKTLKTLSRTAIAVWNGETGERISFSEVKYRSYSDRAGCAAGSGEVIVFDDSGSTISRLDDSQDPARVTPITSWDAALPLDQLVSSTCHISPDATFAIWVVRNRDKSYVELRIADLQERLQWSHRWEHAKLESLDVDWSARRVVVPIIVVDQLTKAETQELQLHSFADE